MTTPIQSPTSERESFAKLFSEFEEGRDVKEGASIEVLVTKCDSNRVKVNGGLKSDCEIAVEEFRAPDGKLTVKEGDYVKVKVESLDDGRGRARVSHIQYKRDQAWKDIKQKFLVQEPIEGTIQDRVKGGYSVYVEGLRCFLPGSLVDIFPIADPNSLCGTVDRFIIERTKDDYCSAILNRKVLRERELVGNEMDKINFAIGDIVTGKITAIAEYPECVAFVKIGESLHGRLHRSDMSWSRINQIADYFKVDEEVTVKILDIELDKQRIKVGIKQTLADPLEELAKRYSEGSRLFGKVTAIKEYGAFVEIENGLEGLVHVSEMDWLNNNVKSDQMVKTDQEVEVMMLSVDLKSRRISLGMKQCQPNPWEDFNNAYRKGSKLSGKILAKMEFGMFVSLLDDLRGLVHISDVSYSESGEEAIKNYSVGQEVKVVLLSVDIEKQRISLGIKQLVHDDFDVYTNEHPARTIVTGEVINVGDKVAKIQLAPNVVGHLPYRELANKRVRTEDIGEYIKLGENVEVLITSFDEDKHQISLSLKAKEKAEETEAVKELRRKNERTQPKTTSFGSMVQETMAQRSDKAEDSEATDAEQHADSASDEADKSSD